MKRWMRVALVAVAVCSFGIALSYPIMYKKNQESNTKDLNKLAALRREIMSEQEAAETETGENDSPVSGDVNNVSSPAKEDLPGGPEGTRDGEASGTGEKTGGESAGDHSEDHKGSAAAGTGTSIEAETGDEAVPEAGNEAESEPETEKPQPGLEDLLLDYVPGLTWRQVTIPEYESLDAPVLLAEKKEIIDREKRTRGIPYNLKEKVQLDEDKILPELKPIYEQNHDLTGWISIEDTVIDYPVVQTNDSEFYLEHDFYGEENVNGQIILDTKCDNYTPSYNLVISGHHMRNGSMFGNLQLYSSKDYWNTHKIVEFDSLMERRTYVVMAAFYSADYDEYEEGFRYNADIVYEMDADMWLEEIEKVKVYDTEVDAHFGDEFITLTTCDRSRRQDGRFVLIGRRVREGEEIS